MRIHILSDLHLEFGLVDVPPSEADVVVLAGDVHVGMKGIHWIRTCFDGRPVVYVLGNHEFYHHSLPELTESLKRETHESNIQVLENDMVELAEFKFLGCTLWTSFTTVPEPEAAMKNAEALMNDYRIIRNSVTDRRLRARETAMLHRESVLWLEGELSKHDPSRTIVVTHHAPSRKSEAARYLNSPLSPAFASNLDELIERSGVPLWVHGHTHYNVDYRLGTTRILTNQRGYPNQRSAGFNPSLVVEI